MFIEVGKFNQKNEAFHEITMETNTKVIKRERSMIADIEMNVRRLQKYNSNKA